MDEPIWKDEPDVHDFQAAYEYLSLVSRWPADLAAQLSGKDTVKRMAKDILRASGLPLLQPSDRYLQRELDKIDKGKKLSPVLLVRGQPLVIADGYHRVCASYWTDPDTEVPCRIAGASD